MEKAFFLYLKKFTHAQILPGKSCTTRVCVTPVLKPLLSDPAALSNSVSLWLTPANLASLLICPHQCFAGADFSRNLSNERVRNVELSLSFCSIPVFHYVWSCQKQKPNKTPLSKQRRHCCSPDIWRAFGGRNVLALGCSVSDAKTRNIEES